TFPAQVNETAPFVRPAKPLAACRLAIVTTAGLHRRGDRPFAPGDQTYRVIASHTPTADIIQSHTSIGFDRVPTIPDVHISFPLGMAFGRPDDPELQHRVLRAALDLLAEPAGPVLRDFPAELEPGDHPAAPPQASGITASDHIPDDVAMETMQMRRYHERWLEKNRGRTHLGLTGIPATRFRGLVRFLEGFADGQDVDMVE